MSDLNRIIFLIILQTVAKLKNVKLRDFSKKLMIRSKLSKLSKKKSIIYREEWFS